MNDEPIQGLLELRETEVSVPTLSVMVDFNDLFADYGDTAFDLIGKLKDLLA